MTIDYTESQRRREIVPAIPFLYLKEKSGKHRIINADGKYMGWGARIFKTSDFKLKNASVGGRPVFIQIQYTGYYEITLETSLKITDGDVDRVRIDLIKSVDKSYTPGTWYNYITGAACHSSVTTTAGNSMFINHVMYLEKGEWIAGYSRVYGESDPFEIESEPDSDRFIIKWIPMKGWNNNSAGKVNYRGRVRR